MPGLFPTTIDGHDSGTESDGDLEQEDDLIQEHEMELSLSSRQDTVSPTDTACSSESPAFLGASAASHLLLYDQNSSEEELEVINGGAGAVGSCDVEVGSVCGVPSRIGAADGSGGADGVIIGGGIGVAIIDSHGRVGVHEEDDDDEDEDDRTEEIVEEEDDDEGEDEEDGEEEEEEEEDYRAPPVTAPTPTAMTTATTIIGSAIGPMDTSSSSSNSGGIIRGQFVSMGGAAAMDGVLGTVRTEVGLFLGRSDESVDDFSDELSGLTATVSGLPKAAKVSSANGKRFGSVSSLLEKRKRSLAHNSDDEVRYLLEQQQQQLQTPLQAHHQHSHQHHHHQHHHRQHHSLRQQQQQHQHQHHHQPEQHPDEDALLSAPVNFRTSPPLEALKPHRGHMIQRSTTPLVLSEAAGQAPGAGVGLLLSAGAGSSGFYGTGGGSSTGGGVGGTGLRFGLGRRPIGCDSPLAAVMSHRSNGGCSNHQQELLAPPPPPPQSHDGCGGGVPSTTTTTTTAASTTRTTSSSSTPSSVSSLARLGGGDTSSPSLEPCGGALVTNMDVSRSVSPPAKVFHCAVSPRRRQSRHQQHQRLQRPHRPCLDFDKMQQLKARSVTTWRHNNEHSGELSVFCW